MPIADYRNKQKTINAKNSVDSMFDNYVAVGLPVAAQVSELVEVA